MVLYIKYCPEEQSIYSVVVIKKRGGAAFYMQQYLPLCEMICVNEMDFLWIQIFLHFSNQHAMDVCPASAKFTTARLDKICDSIALTLDERRDLFVTGDYNIDLKSFGKKTKLLNISRAIIYVRMKESPQQTDLGIQVKLIYIS